MRKWIGIPIFAVLTGCQTIGFYSQGALGQAEILWKAKPSRAVIAAAETSPAIRERLSFALELCDFASEHLALPGDSAYHRYTDLGRDHVVYVLYAAKEFSMQPKQWFYPIVGELDYRGYFKKADAETYAESLRAQQYEIYLGGTDAFSTLGYFHDPVLNTFADYPEIDFAETIFHELTHRRIFKKGETMFNESLANTVAEEGVRRFLRSKGRLSDLTDYEQRLIRRREFYQEIERSREQLTALYAGTMPVPEMRARKAQILAQLKKRAQALQRRWGGKQLENWLALDLTNAHLISLITYNQDMPRFKQLLDEAGGDFERFFKMVETLD
ncbi:MAG: aminopeptidase [Verrucomicrobia bacterium]|nr:MAG: aminopeptidase [Verrucomicrobiota bacterium]